MQKNEIKEIFLQGVPKTWDKSAFLQGVPKNMRWNCFSYKESQKHEIKMLFISTDSLGLVYSYKILFRQGVGV